jgi:hypothetical protein
MNGCPPQEKRVTLIIRHPCGHVRAHEYASRSAADMDAPRQRARHCPECLETQRLDADRAKAAEMARVRREKKETRCP